jgi:hypothetical protein
MPAELHVGFADDAALEREYTSNLVHGRAFVADATGWALFSVCVLVLRAHTGNELKIPCDVVMVRDEDPMRGVALQFRDRSAAALEALRAFVFGSSATPRVELNARAEFEVASLEDTDAATDQESSDPAFDEAETGELSGPPTRSSADGGSPAQREPSVLRLSEERRNRLRNLPLGERIKVAHGPVLEDRVLLERLYGSSVWEHLLRNPRVTVPEVARMARKGTMPRPLLELIVDNEQWIRQGVIRRALLSNPRLSPEAATKILRSMSARELRLVPQQTAYPDLVRRAALRLMRGH